MCVRLHPTNSLFPNMGSALQMSGALTRLCGGFEHESRAKRKRCNACFHTRPYKGGGRVRADGGVGHTCEQRKWRVQGHANKTELALTAARTLLTLSAQRSHGRNVSVFSVKSISEVLNTHSGLLFYSPLCDGLGRKKPSCLHAFSMRRLLRL